MKLSVVDFSMQTTKETLSRICHLEMPRNPFIFQLKIVFSSFFKLHRDLNAYRKTFFNEMDRQGISAIVCPASPFPALPIGWTRTKLGAYEFGFWTFIGSLTGMCGGLSSTFECS